MTEQPEILYGVPTQAEFDVARARSGRRGVLVLPESMRSVFSQDLHDWAETPQTWKTLVTQSTTSVPGVVLDPDQPAPDLDPEQHFGHGFTEIRIQNDILPRLIQALHVAKSIIGERAETAALDHPIQEDHVQLHALIRVLTDAAADAKARESESEIPEWREREKLFESRESEIDILWHEGRIDDAKYAKLRRELREEFGYDREWGPIPRYAMLDIWMAIYGADNSGDFEIFADEHGYAETWARICAMVREDEDRIESDFTESIHPDETTMAEEPIEQRLQRAWLNGFREGFERSAYIGRDWDHR